MSLHIYNYTYTLSRCYKEQAKSQEGRKATLDLRNLTLCFPKDMNYINICITYILDVPPCEFKLATLLLILERAIMGKDHTVAK